MKPRSRTISFAVIATCLILPFGVPSRVDAATKKTPKSASTATQSPFPDVTVNELPSGKPFAFASLAASTKPVLVWFWAPT